MSKSYNVEKLINEPFKRAVLRREDIKRTYIVLDSLIHNYGMEQYFNVAKQRIIDMEGVDYLLEHDHIEFDLLNGVMNIDEVALLCCQDIIKGYIEESYFKTCLELIRAKDEGIRICNSTIKYYRDKSLCESVKDYFKYVFMKPIDDQHRVILKAVLKCYRLELVSRFPVVRLYYRFHYWLCKTAASILAHKLIKRAQLEKSN